MTQKKVDGNGFAVPDEANLAKNCPSFAAPPKSKPSTDVLVETLDEMPVCSE